MIKRIIFDLDNTLIPWNKDWDLNIKMSLEEVGIKISQEEFEKLKLSLKEYEKKYSIYKKETMLFNFEETLKRKIPKEFIDIWIENLKNCYVIDKKIEEILSYLSKKYELVVLTNWFTEQQKVRLERANLAQYFKEIIGTDQILNKPNKEAFERAIYPHSKKECIMIGDDLNTDIKGAINSGIDYLHLNIKNEKTDYKSINSLDELKEIL